MATVNNAENVRALERQIAKLGTPDVAAAELTNPVLLQRRRTR
ncbi:hypothetical protein OG393_18735 [Streptomyces sp. NBC_01216]|nr:hypothetical protein OG393_18735 [Streptomyces sp. NBC_01216]